MSRQDQQRLLDEMVAQGLISLESSQRSAALLEQTGVHVVSGLRRLNAIAEAPLYQFYAGFVALPLLNADNSDVEQLARSVHDATGQLGLSTSWLVLKGILPFDSDGASWIAFREEVEADVLQLMQRKARLRGQELRLTLITPSLFERLSPSLQTAQQTFTAAGDDLRALRELAEEGPTIELVNAILSKAVTRRASDVHVEPSDVDFSVRVRVDGEMLLQERQPRDRFDAVVCRIKILSNLDIAERRLPQDGRINARVNGEAFDIRVSVLPGSAGESIVLRLLRQERKPTRLQDLGMSAAQAAVFEAWSQFPNGIVLVTGPTGSGKSTTLYTALELANDQTKKIITVEDPVEYKIGGITQLQVNPEIGFTFASALRSVLRHDPDVILVGEIRDEETARISIQSSLTGHLVFSTLHTNSAIGAVTRLTDMGIEPFLISASVRGLMAQRLVRKLCPVCAQPSDSEDAATRTLIDGWAARHPGQPVRLMRPVGCPQCSSTGYFGRIAIYDLIEIDSTMASLIAKGVGEHDLLKRLDREEDDGLLQAGLGHVAAGTTTVAELIRSTG
ncbi:GspE/PulE family protein [Piscinibacter sakaiensis]|uniref:GspE/PulE family protein n=1 Tax=Piscinibacter sakaiensis TaxID=1547922 RepID=UPI003AAE5A16